MQEVEIRFEEGREGIVPVGTYLIDAARRMGAATAIECHESDEHQCKFAVTQGSELLSQPTSEETDQLTTQERERGIRLGCYARIEKQGVIAVMSENRKEEEKENTKTVDREEAYRKEFSELPLEKKIANLMQLEAIALGETFAFVVNSPFKVFEKIGDVMAEFGFKKEEDEKRRARPAEAFVNEKSGDVKKKRSQKKQPSQNEPKD